MSRETADLTASEACDAIGLNYGMSRAMLWDVLHGKRFREPVKEFSPLKRALDYGKEYEHVSLAAYNDITGAEAVENKRDFTNTITGITELLEEKEYRLSARPDAVLYKGVEDERTLEIKTSTPEKEALPWVPKGAHVMQCAMQMMLVPMDRAHLFYFQPSTGEYRLFTLHWNQHAWQYYIETWLLEFLDSETTPPPMKRGEAARREAILLEAFWKDGKDTASGPS